MHARPWSSPEAVALMTDLMHFDPNRRPTASQALQYPFFQKNVMPSTGAANIHVSTTRARRDGAFVPPAAAAAATAAAEEQQQQAAPEVDAGSGGGAPAADGFGSYASAATPAAAAAQAAAPAAQWPSRGFGAAAAAAAAAPAARRPSFGAAGGGVGYAQSGGIGSSLAAGAGGNNASSYTASSASQYAAPAPLPWPGGGARGGGLWERRWGFGAWGGSLAGGAQQQQQPAAQQAQGLSKFGRFARYGPAQGPPPSGSSGGSGGFKAPMSSPYKPLQRAGMGGYGAAMMGGAGSGSGEPQRHDSFGMGIGGTGLPSIGQSSALPFGAPLCSNAAAAGGGLGGFGAGARAVLSHARALLQSSAQRDSAALLTTYDSGY
ncbi:hypothetical protein JKP88DRAFT_327962 [Tribonema minus]|uniref:Uncharacterized protein n=1 Tax=Tribonema minus TaxID=303371 RepID=A0A835YQ39_9STRA|nr:hypothetical protein JKP88DRAFT_327962 [Tribonema minus]